jgi:NAD dependent epimerase/dehydratase family enzyme
MDEEIIETKEEEVLVDHACAEVQVDKPKSVLGEVTQEMRDKIIEEYILSVARGEAAPKVIASASAVEYREKREPRTLCEAERIAANFFKGENL